MADNDTPNGTSAPAKANPPLSGAIQGTTDAEQELTLTEFCIRLSSRDRRVALIGGFNYTETQTGVIKDLESKFQARFDAFANKPV
jgi:hypothetical protein